MSHNKSKRYHHGTGLNITSMMDVFTIVLIFLLKSFAAEGKVLTQADNLKLPLSVSSKTVNEVLLTVIVDKSKVLVDNVPVIETSLVSKQDTILIPQMLKVLKEKREDEKKLSMIMGEQVTGKVIIQLDKNINYDIMYKVMATCGYSGYTDVAFAVINRNGGE